MRHLTADLVINAGASLGECPRWDPGRGALLFLDIEHQALCNWRPGNTSHRELRLTARVTAFAPSHDDVGFVAATEDGIGWLDSDDGQVYVLESLVNGAVAGMNDAAVDPYGRFWAGSSSLDRSRRDGKLWMLDTDLCVYVMLQGVGMSNGLGWLNGGAVLVHVDTLVGTVTAYDVREGWDRPELTNPRVVVSIDSSEGLPDGMAVDETGGIWLALWGAGQVRRYTPHGKLDTTVVLDASQATSCCFGGLDLMTLYVTSARKGLARPLPADGGVFGVAVDVAGMPEVPFAAKVCT